MKEARTNAQLLTLLGDLPEVDAKPPENVLFVCRLNPVTRGEDLEIIFSRFGEILSCEVIYDRRTGNSLQYAFIEFARKEDCEEAYFKMDNVVIDDRRIHVDFSQSVAKEWFRYRKEKLGYHEPHQRRLPPRPHQSNSRPRRREPTPDEESPEIIETTPERRGMEYLLSDKEDNDSSLSESPKRKKSKIHSTRNSEL